MLQHLNNILKDNGKLTPQYGFAAMLYWLATVVSE